MILFSVPDAFPRNLTAINSGPQGVFLSWVPPPLNKHNGVITGYVVKIIGLRELDVDNTTSHSIGGLNASSSYSFSVAAKTSVGPGPFSKPVSVVTHHGGNAGKTLSAILYIILFSSMHRVPSSRRCFSRENISHADQSYLAGSRGRRGKLPHPVLRGQVLSRQE